MPTLEFFERPSLSNSILFAAWAGWPDAAESATRAIRELIRQLPAKKFAAIDAEEFYDFSQHRPLVSTDDSGARVLTWPANEFYYWKSPDESARDIVIFQGVEPSLRWRQYAADIETVAASTGVELLITVGALLDSVPHTRSPRITGSSMYENLGPGLESVRYQPPTYEGPSGMTSVISDVLGKRGIKSASIWGHAPHYVQVAHNPVLTHALLRELRPFLPKDLDLSRLDKESREFSDNLGRALEDQKEIEGYVRRLEERYDSEEAQRGSPEPAQLVRELEEFLRQQRLDEQSEGGDKDA